MKSNLKLLKQFLVLLGVLSMAGCGPGLSPEETGALDIAKAAVAANDTWADRAEYQTPVQNQDGSWSVTVWRLPKTPEGYRTTRIDSQGQVTDYFRGY